MAATAIETIPSTWDDERDNAFFRITAHLFSCEFSYGAGVLLASYDDELDEAAATSASPTPAAISASTVAPITIPAVSR